MEGITINLQKVEAQGIDDQKARAITMNQFILALRKVVAPNIFFIWPRDLNILLRKTDYNLSLYPIFSYE